MKRIVFIGEWRIKSRTPFNSFSSLSSLFLMGELVKEKRIDGGCGTKANRPNGMRAELFAAERASEPIHFFINQQIKIILIFWIDWRDWMEVARSANNQSIKHINQSKTFDWMIEFDWIWLMLRHLPFHFNKLMPPPFPLRQQHLMKLKRNLFC